MSTNANLAAHIQERAFEKAPVPRKSLQALMAPSLRSVLLIYQGCPDLP